MDRSRKATRERTEATLALLTPHEQVLLEERATEDLSRLLAGLDALGQTPAGATEIERRTRAFGSCQRLPEETAVVFHGRLRQWSEREIPPTKMPLHPPRQVP
jgi:hypothetical protein